MQSEVIDVIIKALIQHDMDRIKAAVLNGDDAGLRWLSDLLEDGHTGYAQLDTCDLIDEFQARGLELVARERSNVYA